MPAAGAVLVRVLVRDNIVLQQERSSIFDN